MLDTVNHATLAHLLELYGRLISTPVAGDQLMARFFRLRPKLEASQRAFLAEAAYAMLRKRIRTMLLWQWAGVSQPRFQWPDPAFIPRALPPGEEAALALFRFLREDTGVDPVSAEKRVYHAVQKLKEARLPSGEQPLPEQGEPLLRLREAAASAADSNLQHAPDPARRAAHYSIPSDILARWSRRFGDAQAEVLASAMQQHAPLDLRVNTLKGTRDQLAAELLKRGFDASPTPYSPHGLRLARHANVFRTDLFEQGWFEVQDEGSQLVALALDPKPTWKVLDACAGAGGKTLHLAALMKNRGEVFAHDLNADRLEGLRKRVKRSNAQNVRVLSPGEAPARGPYDAVLIDAPCLGLGTLRRNPDLAWRAPLHERLTDIVQLQRECLRSYAPLLKQGGILLYATCSFEEEETTAMVAELEGFEPTPLAPVLERSGISSLADPAAAELTLLPSLHGTDGFYVARFRKKAAPAY